MDNIQIDRNPNGEITSIRFPTDYFRLQVGLLIPQAKQRHHEIVHRLPEGKDKSEWMAKKHGYLFDLDGMCVVTEVTNG